MKVILLLSLVAAVTTAPQYQPANWELVPDSDGALHIVDLSTYEIDPEAHFDAINDMIFWLFTRSNPTEGQQIVLNNAASLADSNFNPDHPTRFTIHGWLGDRDTSVNPEIRNAYLSRGDFNCITVDWATGASTVNYITARNRVGTIGAITAMFIDFLEAQTGVDLNTINVIGYSLAGHVAGFVGKNTQGRLNTIIGSDPAAPLFSMDAPDQRLADTDAQYVETIITAGGTMGMWGPLGVANFYPNGGSSQPGCGIDVSGACAHERANFLIAESIASPVSQFVARRCGDLSEIQSGLCFVTGPEARLGGEPSNFGRGASGVYALTTNGASPFAQG